MQAQHDRHTGYRPEIQRPWWLMEGRWRAARLRPLGLCIAMAVCCLTGCAGLQQSYREQLLDQLMVRATFDLDCARHQLRAVPLEPGDLRESLVGVQGCGRKATYVRLNNLWVANTPDIEAFQEEQFRRSNAGLQMSPSR